MRSVRAQRFPVVSFEGDVEPTAGMLRGMIGHDIERGIKRCAEQGEMRVDAANGRAPGAVRR
ncbi:hypothetical protein SAMN05216505_10853 [Streptomyces prasinopilosus]|uniref:Uncharacterized protein n=1 Tax=Streptomyces prasinopilosus TaxID=67344 RepID=A0A1G6V0M4_9ACTN|nr:hypothetical protein SAMN05216505_10853 [Streptomyces prasinopilosus]